MAGGEHIVSPPATFNNLTLKKTSGLLNLTDFYPDPRIENNDWKYNGKSTLADFVPAKLIPDALRELAGRIPGIGGFFGNYRNPSVYEEAEYDAVVALWNATEA